MICLEIYLSERKTQPSRSYDSSISHVMRLYCIILHYIYADSREKNGEKRECISQSRCFNINVNSVIYKAS